MAIPNEGSLTMSTRHIHTQFIAKLEAERLAHIARCNAVREYLALMARLAGRA